MRCSQIAHAFVQKPLPSPPPQGTARPTEVAEGQFASDTGNSKATSCFAGQYAPETGRGSCTPCPAGHFCPALQTPLCWNELEGFFVSEQSNATCEQQHVRDIRIQSIRVGISGSLEAARNDTVMCTPGFVCDQPDGASVGRRCPAGHYCMAGTLTVDIEPPCPAENHCMNRLARDVPMPRRVKLTVRTLRCALHGRVVGPCMCVGASVLLCACGCCTALRVIVPPVAAKGDVGYCFGGFPHGRV